MSVYQKLHRVESADVEIDTLPEIDFNQSTKRQSLIAIVFGALGGICCLVLGITLFALPSPGVTYNLRKRIPYGGTETLAFAVNFFATQCLESLAYVHSISLRWALIREDLLKFNTNLRLLTSSKTSGPNRWYSNIISAALLVLCYASTSQLFFTDYAITKETDQVLSNGSTNSGTSINTVALVALGIAFIGQTSIASWCYWTNLRDIPSWGSNPLNTTLVERHLEKYKHRDGRCMRSALSVDDTNTPCQPSERQPSPVKVRPTLRYTVWFLWVLVGLSIIWTALILFLIGHQAEGLYHNTYTEYYGYGSLWSWSGCDGCLGQGGPNYVNLTIVTYDEIIYDHTDMPYGTQLFLGILILCLPQLFQAAGLHCAELIVNLSRDEDTWRRLNVTNKSNSKDVLKQPPLLAALTSWKYCMLFLSKVGLHWLLGQCIIPSFQQPYGIRLSYVITFPRLFTYTVCTIILALFITFLVYHKPKGPQPAAYGHIQVLADLIDDWEVDDKGRFWWGDKGDEFAKTGIRHAGMSARKENLEPIRATELYAGATTLLYLKGTQ